VGLGIQPKEDKVNVFDTILNLEAKTVKVDSLYLSRTINGLLGNFYDPNYGNINAEYICQYYPSIGFDTAHILDNKIDSVRLNIYYTSYVGDSLIPMEVTVYPVNKALDDHFYTNVKPENYCDMSNPWGKKAYTAFDLAVPDTERIKTTFYPNVAVDLPISVGEKILSIYKEHKGFNDLEKFVELFPGTYVKSTFGTGNLLKVDITEISTYYTRKYVSAATGNDTMSMSRSVLTVTGEVSQLNRIRSTNDEHLLQDNDSVMYIKTPAGIFPQITIPISTIVEGIGKRKFSSVKLKINACPKAENLYALPFPGIGTVATSLKTKLLLIEADSLKPFFENHQSSNSQTNFTTTYTASTATYNFDNISNLIQHAIDRTKPGEKTEDLQLLLVPIQVEFSQQSSGYTYYDQEYGTEHHLSPAAVTLRKGGDHLQLKIIASDLEINTR
jgi:hypothetical protein